VCQTREERQVGLSHSAFERSSHWTTAQCACLLARAWTTAQPKVHGRFMASSRTQPRAHRPCAQEDSLWLTASIHFSKRTIHFACRV